MFFGAWAATFIAACLTLLSGFGLATLLLPVFALWFPLPAAVAVTAVVHFANGLFKLALLGRQARWMIVLRFGAPALAAAAVGAKTLLWLAGLAPLASYALLGRTFYVVPVKLAVAAVMAFCAAWESRTRTEVPAAPPSLLLGGLLSGFFGGLSGHQGAFRSAFLIRLGLPKEAYVATGSAVASLVDVGRLGVYVPLWRSLGDTVPAALLGGSIAAAFFGSWAGTRFLKGMSTEGLKRLVAGMLWLFAGGLGLGLL